MAPRTGLGGKPYLASNAWISVPRIGRDMGPNWAVPSISAGGAVPEPAP